MITATLTLDDYIAAHRLHHQQARRVMYLAGLLVLTVGLGLAYTKADSAPIGIFAGIGAIFGNWWSDRFALPAKVLKLYRQFKGISEPMTFSWDAEEIEGRNANGHGKRRWKDYVRFKEDDDVFLLYLTDQLWHAYPKHWFESAEQLEEFRSCARMAGTQ